MSRCRRGQWRTADFAPGDVLIFSMHTLHMSTTNTTQRARISADVRWLPAGERADPRYVGDVETYLKQMSKATLAARRGLGPEVAFREQQAYADIKPHPFVTQCHACC